MSVAIFGKDGNSVDEAALSRIPLDSRVQWEGRSWRLRVDTFRRSDGASVEKAFIEHPGSVVLIPLIDEQVVMLRQYRPALEKTILELPAGTRESEESWLACAQRELREETGYRADSFTSLGLIWPGPGLTNELMALFIATGLTSDPLPADFDEEITLAPMPLAELATMARDGRLQDGKSIVAILRAEAYLTAI